METEKESRVRSSHSFGLVRCFGGFSASSDFAAGTSSESETPKAWSGLGYVARPLTLFIHQSNQSIKMTQPTQNDLNISYYESKKGGWIQRIVRRLTRWAWASHVRAPINRMHERGLINSQVYHEAHDYATRMIYATPPPQPNAKLRDAGQKTSNRNTDERNI